MAALFCRFPFWKICLILFVLDYKKKMFFEFYELIQTMFFMFPNAYINSIFKY